ncbi:MAG: sialate O-acetylesterase, partial [Haloferula sp.]
MKILALLTLLITTSVVAYAETEQPVHLFILSGQSNMAGMDPETGFMPEAKKLFKDEKVVYIKVAKGGQPICRWLEEWQDIAKKNGLRENDIKRIHKDGEVEFYQPILDQYKEMLKKHPKFNSVTFCWMQGERDANGGGQPAYKDALKLLISKLRRDLERPDMNIVIGRLSDAGQKKESWGAMRKIQMEIVNEDASGAWVDVD